MNLIDVNVLIYAFRKDTEKHLEFRSWMLQIINGDSAFGLTEQVLASVIRITTHPRVFKEPSRFEEAVSFVELLRGESIVMWVIWDWKSIPTHKNPRISLRSRFFSKQKLFVLKS